VAVFKIIIYIARKKPKTRKQTPENNKIPCKKPTPEKKSKKPKGGEKPKKPKGEKNQNEQYI